MKPIALAAALLALMPAWAFAWRAQNGYDVLPLSNGSFEVVARPGAGPREFWCAAGDYTYGFLRVAAAQRIYVSRPRGPSTAAPGRIAVTFSLTPPQGVDLGDCPIDPPARAHFPPVEDEGTGLGNVENAHVSPISVKTEIRDPAVKSIEKALGS